MARELTNLLDETIQVLHNNDKTSNDVLFVQTPDGYFTWDEFAAVAKTINYYDGYGTVEINPSIVIVGQDWWLERREYDGSEWWDFLEKPEITAPIELLTQGSLLNK